MNYLNRFEGLALLKRTEREVKQIVKDFPSLKLHETDAYLWEGPTVAINLRRVNEAVIVDVENLETGMDVCSFDARYLISVRSALKFFNVF